MYTSSRPASRPFVPVLLCAVLAAGCGEQPPPAATVATPAEPATATSRAFGDHVIYFNAIRTDSLTPEVATSYGIVRSANRALVNISLARQAEGSAGTPVPGAVTVQAVNLNGQLKDLKLREIREGEAVYYIGDVSVTGDETLVFTVNAIPEGTSVPLTLKFQRQFVGGTP